MFRHTIITALAVFAASISGARAEEPLELLEQRAFQAAAERVAPAVVQIQTFGGLDRVGDTLTGTGPTTGLIVSTDGHIVSSAFAFVTKPAAVVVKLADGRQLDATIVATDFSRMLTLLKVDAVDLPVAAPAPLDDARVGDWALALGKVFDAAVPNASPGILSAKNRIWGKALQTDAKTSPFNYGGPLIDIDGRVLGIVVPMSMTSDDVMTGAEWYDSGIGFAVPFAQVQESVERLRDGEDQYRGVLGVTMSRPGQLFAVPVVESVRDDSPAATAGLQKGDVIIRVDGHAIERQAHVLQALGTHYAGDVVEVVVQQGDAEQVFSIELERPTKTSITPDQQPAQQPGDDEQPDGDGA